MENDTKALTCPGCNATFKHALSLSTHKNGSKKKGLNPCMAYYKHVGKEYEAKVETRTLTPQDYDLLLGISTKIWAWIEKNEKKAEAVPLFALKSFGEEFPPLHVNPAWIKEKFMRMRFEEFIPTLFSACHTNTTEGREHCVIRIPKVTHDVDLEVYDGRHWRPMKIHNMLIEFLGNTYRYLYKVSEENEDDQDFQNRFTRFERWTPDTAEQIMKGSKMEENEEGVMRTYLYTKFVKLVKAVLLGDSRDVINSIKKEHQKLHKEPPMFVY